VLLPVLMQVMKRASEATRMFLADLLAGVNSLALKRVSVDKVVGKGVGHVDVVGEGNLIVNN